MPGNLPGCLRGHRWSFLVLVCLSVLSYALGSDMTSSSNANNADSSCVCSLPLNLRDGGAVFNDPPCKFPHTFSLQYASKGTQDPKMTNGIMNNIKQITLVSSISSFRCVDSRQAYFASHRTWGGDFLEFLRVLSFAKQSYGLKVNQRIVDAFFHSWLDRPSKERMEFHYSTDVDALKRIVNVLKEHYGVAGDQLVDIVKPNPVLEPFLYRVLGMPVAHGNAALRVGLELQELAGVDVDILPMLSRSVFRLLWKKQTIGVHGTAYNKIHLHVLSGKHAPVAYMEVHDNDDCKERHQHSAVSIGYHNMVVGSQNQRMTNFITLEETITEQSNTNTNNTDKSHMESVFDTNGAAWIELSTEEDVQAEIDAEEYRKAPDQKIVSLLESQKLPLSMLSRLDDTNEAVVSATHNAAKVALKSGLLSNDDKISNALTAIMGQEWIDQAKEEIISQDSTLVQVDESRQVVVKALSEKQEKMQILLFSKDAVQSYRRDLLMHLNKQSTFGEGKALWKHYQKVADKHDNVYKRIFASKLPQYRLYVQ